MPLARDLRVSAFRAEMCAHLKEVEMLQSRFRLLRAGRPLAAVVTLADLAALELVDTQSSERRWARIARDGQQQDWLAEALDKARKGQDVRW